MVAWGPWEAAVAREAGQRAREAGRLWGQGRKRKRRAWEEGRKERRAEGKQGRAAVGLLFVFLLFGCGSLSGVSAALCLLPPPPRSLASCLPSGTGGVSHSPPAPNVLWLFKNEALVLCRPDWTRWAESHPRLKGIQGHREQGPCQVTHRCEAQGSWAGWQRGQGAPVSPAGPAAVFLLPFRFRTPGGSRCPVLALRASGSAAGGLKAGSPASWGTEGMGAPSAEHSTEQSLACCTSRRTGQDTATVASWEE